MRELLEQMQKFKWGVVGLFVGAAALVGAEVVPLDDPAVRAGAGAAAGVALVGGPIVLARLAKRFLAPKDAPKP